MKKTKDYKPTILVYGIDKVGIAIPKENIETELGILHFEPFNTEEKFQDYDGLILFQTTFERIIEHKPAYSSNYITVECFSDELQRRKKQYQLLMDKKGFICILLITPFIDRDEYNDTSGTDLAKCALNYSDLYRKHLGFHQTSLRTVRNEFINFIKHFGAAHTYFEYYGDTSEIKEICNSNNNRTGMILLNREYFIPALKPKRYEIERYFKILADSLISCHKKLSEEIPDWADEYKFEQEKDLIKEKNALNASINKINQKLLQFREYKKCICYDDELLRESVIKILREGFGHRIDERDEFKEDFKIINSENKPLVLVEVKGTNKGITREHINQADSHRERAGLDENFPSVIIVNTNIKKSNSLKDKYQEIAKEQIKHSVKMNILVMRAIDLLNILYLNEKGELSKEDFLNLLKHENGWLKVSQETYEVIK